MKQEIENCFNSNININVYNTTLFFKLPRLNQNFDFKKAYTLMRDNY